MNWAKIIEIIKDILFPIFCVECGREGEWWCAKCLKKEKIEGVFACPVCGERTEKGEPCFECLAGSSLDGVTAFFYYAEDKPSGRLIRLHKYHGAEGIGAVWKDVFRSASPKVLKACLGRPVAVVPVPLYPRRERERGYNQSASIASAVVDVLNMAGTEAVADTGHLLRLRATNQQAKVQKEKRRENVSGAFDFKSETKIPESIVLVDDVFTSGATMQECAKVLKQNGAKWVWGITVARG